MGSEGSEMLKYVRMERDAVPFEVDGLRDRAEAADRAGLHDVAEVLTYLADRFDGLIAGGKPKVRDLYAYEVEHLIGTDSPESIARRLGVKPASLARLLYRERRGDLARHFDDRQERRRKQAA